MEGRYLPWGLRVDSVLASRGIQDRNGKAEEEGSSKKERKGRKSSRPGTAPRRKDINIKLTVSTVNSGTRDWKNKVANNLRRLKIPITNS